MLEFKLNECMGRLGFALMPEPSAMSGATLGTLDIDTPVHRSQRLVVSRVRR